MPEELITTALQRVFWGRGQAVVPRSFVSSGPLAAYAHHGRRLE